MKAVVLEVRDGISAVMREDGTVEKLNRVCEVGDVVELEESAKVSSFQKFTKLRSLRVIAASLVAAFLLFAGAFHYSVTTKAFSFVSVDVNPSLEYVLNREDRVISAIALNDDAKSVVERMNREGKLKGKTLSEALTLVTSYLKEMGYFDKEGEPRDVLISVSSENDEISERLAKTAQETMEADKDTPIRVEVKKATLKEHEKAKEYGVSTGRLVKVIEEKKAKKTGKAKKTEEEPDEDLILSEEELEKAKNSSVAELMEPIPEAPTPTPEAEAAPAETPAPEQAAPAKPDKEKNKKKEDKKKKEKEEKEKKKEEEEKSTETEEAATETEEASTEAPAEGTEESTEAPAEPETEVKSTETEMTEEEKAAAEAEEVRKQQEIQAAEQAAEAEVVRQQQEQEAAEGIVASQTEEKPAE